MNLFKKVLLATLISLASVNLATAKFDKFHWEPVIGSSQNQQVTLGSLSDSQLQQVINDYSQSGNVRSAAVLLLTIRYIDRSNYSQAKYTLSSFNPYSATPSQVETYNILKKFLADY
ncbi:hypothetical protein CKF54_04075 [Psittacicella hinzii]|uniref:DUF4476 domain-containing protein n=1 Tax=Psittacicella hinzii TaxID=2028575 RepID=A0A3A1Y9T3_9GAMM|nr:hypothetical protein [Psittacicella hinzii]RIY32877.1 hypothetical protein CKF54_04075 [Psittacicella hinzii]